MKIIFILSILAGISACSSVQHSFKDDPLKSPCACKYSNKAEVKHG